MKTTMIRIIKSYALFLAFLLAACGGGSDSQPQSACSPSNISACGGGGGLSNGSSGGGQTTGAAQLSMVLVNGSGTPANTLTAAAGSLTAKATVLDSNGKPVVGAVVNFSDSDNALATVSPSANLTDANGVAATTVTVPSPSALGAVTIIATAGFVDSKVGATSVSGSVNLSVGSVQNPPQSIALVSISPSNKSILLQGAIGLGRVQTAAITFKITDANGIGVGNQKVNFSFGQGATDLTFTNTSAVTAQDGTVTALMNSGHTVTVATVVATVVDQNNNPVLNSLGAPITAISDQITVTNTVLNPTGISMASDNYELEARDFFGQTSKITVYLTDQNGGAITDGTAVTFTSNGGAIVGNGNSAMCTTVSGQCTVALSAQNPQPAASILRADHSIAPLPATAMSGDLLTTPNGIAIIVASLQLNGSIVKQAIEISMSGSYPIITGTFNASTASCTPFDLTFNMTDEIGNLMPTGTNISIVGAQNAGATVLIGNTLLNRVNPLARGGDSFTLVVTPGGAVACASGAHTATGSFYIKVTTPGGVVSYALVTITYPTT